MFHVPWLYRRYGRNGFAVSVTVIDQGPSNLAPMNTNYIDLSRGAIFAIFFCSLAAFVAIIVAIVFFVKRSNSPMAEADMKTGPKEIAMTIPDQYTKA
jgi:hypothetical protein